MERSDAGWMDALRRARDARPDVRADDGLKLVQLARLYDVHETTAARWVSRAAADVADDARRRLMARLSLFPSSLDSVARMVLSNLDFSIARVLQG